MTTPGKSQFSLQDMAKQKEMPQCKRMTNNWVMSGQNEISKTILINYHPMAGPSISLLTKYRCIFEDTVINIHLSMMSALSIYTVLMRTNSPKQPGCLQLKTRCATKIVYSPNTEKMSMTKNKSRNMSRMGGRDWPICRATLQKK